MTQFERASGSSYVQMVFQYKVRGEIKVKNKLDYNISTEQYNKPEAESRTDLNDFLQKMKDKKKEDFKTNILILSGVMSVGLVVLLILNL